MSVGVCECVHACTCEMCVCGGARAEHRAVQVQQHGARRDVRHLVLISHDAPGAKDGEVEICVL